MLSSPLPQFPFFEEANRRHGRLVEHLSREIKLPSATVAAAALCAEDISPDVLAVVERACRQDLDPDESRLFFRGIHILGGRRLTPLYRPLVSLLHAPPRRVDRLLGDAVTCALSKILAGVYDGDPMPLQSLVLDPGADSFVRLAALHALAFLTFEQRVERARSESFLLRLDEESLLPREDDVLWHGWMTAVAVLGMQSLTPRVRAAFADGRITPGWCSEDDFDRLLTAALERPEDGSRLADEDMGYIEDVVQELERFDCYDDERDKPAPFLGDRFPFKLQEPVRNPLRGVGRNDPCPCGSGKKAKKCCLR
jgi:hypothetical protein